MTDDRRHQGRPVVPNAGRRVREAAFVVLMRAWFRGISWVYLGLMRLLGKGDPRG